MGIFDIILRKVAIITAKSAANHIAKASQEKNKSATVTSKVTKPTVVAPKEEPKPTVVAPKEEPKPTAVAPKEEPKPTTVTSKGKHMLTDSNSIDFYLSDLIYRPDYPYLEKADVPHISLTYEEAIAQGWHFKRKSGKRIRITRYTGVEKDVVIPTEIDGCIVNELKGGLFYRMDINSVMLPATLRKIGNGCFNRSKIRRAVFEDGINHIPKDMFSLCEMLSYVRVSSKLQSVGNGAFFGCKSLKYINLPSCCNTIKECAFENSGLEGLAVSNKGGCLRIHSNSFTGTPLLKRYALVCFIEACGHKNEYHVMLVGDVAKVKFPKDSKVSILAGSLNKACELDLSECSDVYVNSHAAYYPDGKYRGGFYPKSCRIILPKGIKGLWFSRCVVAVYPDGTPYNGYLDVEKANSDCMILKMQSYDLHTNAINEKDYPARHIKIVNKGDFNTIYQYAVDSINLEHLTLERSYMLSGELFTQYCCALHRVDLNGETVWLPPKEMIDWIHHSDLLKAFRCNEKDRFRIFDSSYFDRVFTEQTSKKSLSQRKKLLIAIDVVRSSDLLFPDKSMYRRYLQTHRRYALQLCKKLPDEYAGLLRGYFKVR